MAQDVLLSDNDYSTLRIESREALWRLGIPSNPGLTNGNIINSLANALGVEAELTDDMEYSEFSGEMFRDCLGEILGLELPPEVSKVVTGLQGLST